ncbi:MAG: response regulator [Phycisphaerales bacterium]|nr:response regulator [Phycisphaerae bacterium]NNF43430.1 response regulator [Phycisphaerales bacterium]NNM24948.1 response regulator [Phycisphaerales bacterium]
MPSAPIPSNEPARLDALARLEILDTPSEAGFDRIARLAARLLEAPIAAISLVDREREWFKACVGTDTRQADRAIAFCAHTILHDEMLVVEDARQDPRFADNPQVTEQGVRFYAGAPLRTSDGVNIGALCVKDVRPRGLDDDGRAVLEELGRIVVDEMELRLEGEHHRRTKALLSSVLDSSFDGVLAFRSVRDDAGEITDFEFRLVNRTAAAVLDRDPETLRGRRLRTELSGAGVDTLFARGVDVVETGQPASYEQCCEEGPEKRWYQIAAVPLGDGFAVTFADITARRRAESERQRLFALSLDLLFIADRFGRFRQLNPVWESTLGISVEALLEQPLLDRVHPDDTHIARIAAVRLARGESVADLELRYRCGDGSYRWLVCSAVAENGLIYGVARDISRRKEEERLLRKAKDQAEAATRAKGEFLANMSHEIRTPMNAILGMTDIVLDSTLTVDQRDCLQLVRSSAESLLTVLNDVLDFSKIEAGKLELETVPFQLEHLLGDTLHVLSIAATIKDLEVVCDIGPDVPLYLAGDAGRLRQVFVNLVGNAIKFTAAGEVSVQVRLVSCDGSDARLRFSVADTGVGIAPEKQAVIFHEFVQADGSTTRQHGGTGLGLAISTRLVHLMGGEMQLRSTPGRGSVFSFEIPLRVRPDADHARPMPAFGALRVLAVDDNATNLDLLRRLLGHWGIEASFALGAEAALEAVYNEDPFDLVLLDGHMPGMDGYTLAEEIRKQPGYADTVLIMLTSGASLASSGDRDIAAQIRKPIRSSELLDTMVAALDRKEDPMDDKQASVAEPTSECVPQPLSVLLVEDNHVNQRLAIRLLERRGHEVRLCENGADAVTLTQQERFDVVLMDVQMPVMGGLEATMRIRAAETQTGRATRIIAMTAHAMSGDRQRCLDAGMDDYLSKPINPDELYERVELTLAAEPATEETPADACVNRSELLDRVCGATDILADLIGLFDVESHRLEQRMLDAAAGADADGLASAAHALKGSAGNMAGHRVHAVAAHLERIGRSGDLSLAEDALATLTKELGQMRAELETMQGEVRA